jgi:TPP-dependent 2-oxoacid decarboxylase
MGGLYKKAILRLNFVLMLFIILYNNISIAYAVENTTTENNDIDMYDYSNIDEAINDAGYSGSFEDILKIIYGDYSTQNTNNSFKNKLIKILE